MAEDRPLFRPERAPPDRRNVGVLVALLISVGLALLARPWWEPRLESGVLVEIAGDVPKPGTYLLFEATVAGAVEAAGGDPAGFAATPVPAGHRVILEGPEARIAPPSDPLLVALPVDVNLADAAALDALPGVSRSQAAAIVGDRQRRGPYYTLEDLARVSGISAAKVEALRPFLTVGDIGPKPPAAPLNLNTATAVELEALPGIGPVTAARIVVDRAERGPYVRVDDLKRVKGIGQATVERLRPHLEVEPP